MDITYIARIIGIISIFILFCLKFWIAINPNSTEKTLRVAIFWFSIYVFFLFLVSMTGLYNIGTENERRTLSGFTATIPLVAVVIQLFLEKRLEKKVE